MGSEDVALAVGVHVVRRRADPSVSTPALHVLRSITLAPALGDTSAIGRHLRRPKDGIPTVLMIDRAEFLERGGLGEHLCAPSRIPQLREKFSRPAGEAFISGDSGHPSNLLHR